MKQIELTQGKVAIVDDEDFAGLNQWKWYAVSPYGSRTFYAIRRSSAANGSLTIRMHRDIMQPDKGVSVDHKDGDGLNNQRANLRICSLQENLMNKRLYKNSKCGYKGVHWSPRQRKWKVSIGGTKQRFYLGLFTCLIKAAKAYDKKAKELYGEFASLNFPNQPNNKLKE